MDDNKLLQFKGTPGGFFVLMLVSIVATYIPVLGWAFLLNYASEFFAENTLVNGKQISYKAGYGETLKFIFINSLLLLVTLGIYIFWFYPKMYRYVVDHVSYADAAPAPQATAPPAEPPAAPPTVQ